MGLEVAKDEFGFDHFPIVLGVDFAVDMDDVGVIKDADDMADGVAFANMGEELVTETFAFAGAFDEAGDVDEFDRGGDDFFGANGFSEFFEAMIWYFDDADIGVDCTKWIVGGVSAFGARKSVEKSGFANIWEAYDADF